MSDGPLKAIAGMRAVELAWESAVPLSAAGAAWWGALRVLAAPTVGRPLSDLEWATVFGACAGLTGWAVARQLTIFNKRRLYGILSWAALFVAGMSLAAGPLTRTRFEGQCEALYGGRPTTIALPGGETTRVCATGPETRSAYLGSAVLRAPWTGDLGVAGWTWMLACGLLGALGLRDHRLFPTTVPARVAELVRLRPAVGSAGAVGGVPKSGAVLACANPTLWGEPCGQMYSAEHAFEPFEWCVRCQQPFRASEREITFRVVTLASADIDVLNGLERLDTQAWPRGHAMPADARISGRERWVELGVVRLPDTISVAQALAVVHELLPTLGAARDERVTAATELARDRASKVCAWIWFGRHTNRLTYARPTARVAFAFGPMRLRDVVADSGEDTTLQLEIGFVPVEVRSGHRRVYLTPGRPDEEQNSKVDLWVPVGPTTVSPGNDWVIRIAGDALQRWLATERARADDARGVATPLPYLVTGGTPTTRRPGPLDFVMMSLAGDGSDVSGLRNPGHSISEWDWFDWEQIQLLRQRVLVLVDAEAT